MRTKTILAGAALAALALTQNACTPPQVVDILSAAVAGLESAVTVAESANLIPADQTAIANYFGAVNSCLSAVSTAVKTVPPLNAQQEAIAVAPACVSGLRQIPQLSAGVPGTVLNALNAALPAIVAVLDFIPHPVQARLASTAPKPGIHVKASALAPVDAGIVRVNAKLARLRRP